MQQEAVEDLTYAFEHCPASAEINKARCAYYLIPARMLLGDLPTQALLQRFSLHHYMPIVEVMSAVFSRIIADIPGPCLAVVSMASQRLASVSERC